MPIKSLWFQIYEYMFWIVVIWETFERMIDIFLQLLSQRPFLTLTKKTLSAIQLEFIKIYLFNDPLTHRNQNRNYTVPASASVFMFHRIRESKWVNLQTNGRDMTKVCMLVYQLCMLLGYAMYFESCFCYILCEDQSYLWWVPKVNINLCAVQFCIPNLLSFYLRTVSIFEPKTQSSVI